MKRKQLPTPEVLRELEWIANSFMLGAQIEAAEQILDEIKYLRRRIRAEKSRQRRSRDKNFQAVDNQAAGNQANRNQDSSKNSQT